MPDITKSQFIHRLDDGESSIGNRVIALEHREIVEQSPVSVVAPYHTALIVIAAASAFIISILTLLVLLYRRKVNIRSFSQVWFFNTFEFQASGMNQSENIKDVDKNKEHFLVYSQPIYIELPKDQDSNHALPELENRESIKV